MKNILFITLTAFYMIVETFRQITRKPEENDSWDMNQELDEMKYHKINKAIWTYETDRFRRDG